MGISPPDLHSIDLGVLWVLNMWEYSECWGLQLMVVSKSYEAMRRGKDARGGTRVWASVEVSQMPWQEGEEREGRDGRRGQGRGGGGMLRI